MWMLASVTPRSVAPLAPPGPHGDASVPNLPLVELAEVVEPLAAAVVPEDELPRPPPHPAATTRTASATRIPRAPRRFDIFSPFGHATGATSYFAYCPGRVQAPLWGWGGSGRRHLRSSGPHDP